MVKMNKGGKRTVRILCIASFLNDMGSDMIYPIWPLFVTSFLGANVAVLGLIDGLGNAVVSISQAISGYLSDKLQKRKIFISTGYLFASLSRIAYAISSVWQYLIPFRILDRAGKIREAPRDAMIADISSHRNRGRNFGLLRAMDNLGAVSGIIICIALFSLVGFRNLLFLASIPSLVAVSLVIVFIKERKTKKIYKGFSFKNLNKNFVLFLSSSSIFALGFFSYSFLLVYAKEFGFQITFIPILYLIFTVVASVMSLPFGKLADKLGRKVIIILSNLFFVGMCLGFIYLKSYWEITTLFILYGLHLSSKIPVQKTFVSELCPKRYRATSMGTFQMVTGLCALPASVVAGLLWIKFGMFSPFYLSLGLTVISTILLLFVKERG